MLSEFCDGPTNKVILGVGYVTGLQTSAKVFATQGNV